ncbi:MAG: aminopeptidase P family protein [Alistipes sp.]|jgi:Xaa-Pro aminopeptidase|nr:aminopeptidase P family protein [Alistipes sp.]
MFEKKIYQERRAGLARKMAGRGLILLPGHVESPINYPNNAYRFRQDSNFLYFAGLSLPDLAVVIDTDSDEATLYGNDFTVEDVIWMGPQPSVAELGASVGISRTAPLADLATKIAAAVAKGREVHILPPYRAETKAMITSMLPDAKPSEELIRAVVSMRDKKSPEEIAAIEEACATGYEMHTLAMRMCRPGVSERDIAGAIEGVALQKGWGVSFHSIVSQHGETLHNHSHDGILTPGRMLLVDAGAEATSGYASDFTRTIPVGGRFTSRQKDIYEIVLAANNHAFAISAPGVRYVDVHLAASRVLLEGLHSLGLVRGNIDDAVAAGAHSLFMPHGLGHQMGLDVHDMEDLGERFVGYDDETPRSAHPSCSRCRMGRRLQPGMVVTVEPGIYFVPDLIAKWRAEGGPAAEFVDFDRVSGYLDFGGIRLEDDLLVTATGNRLLGQRRIPITPSEVESATGA